jgi:hypothetical protein
VAGILTIYPDLHIQVEGHTDNVGGVEFNQQLSEQRASSVRAFLVEQGVRPESIESRGAGMSEPVASNDSAAGRQLNRRVDLVVTGKAIGTTVGTVEQPSTTSPPTQPAPNNGYPAGSLPATNAPATPATEPPLPQR